MVRLIGAEAVAFDRVTGWDFSRTFAHLAFCACAILRLEAADMTRVGADVIPIGWLAVRDVPEPFNDVSSEIA